jgi:hypothetical protein
MREQHGERRIAPAVGVLLSRDHRRVLVYSSQRAPARRHAVGA